jgi:hypothetical protein
LGQTNLHDWQFVTGEDNSSGKGLPDVVAINLHDQDGLVGIHVLDGTSSYETMPVQTLTTLPAVNDTQETFVSGPQDPAQRYRDVIAVNMQDIDNKTGVHNLTAASGFQTRAPEVASALQTTSPPAWVFPSTPPVY